MRSVKLLTKEQAGRLYLCSKRTALKKPPLNMDAHMPRGPTGSGVRWRLIHLLRERLRKIRTRNAFADARRAQAARLLAQQVGPLFDAAENRALPHTDGILRFSR